MIKFNKIITFLFLGFFVLSCTKNVPQLPSNKGNVADKNTVSLLAINQNLAKKEDLLLKKFAFQKDKSFKRSEMGFWYKIEQIGNGTKIKDSVICNISCQLLSLNGKVFQNDVKQVIIGKKQLVAGLEEGLKLMNKGGSATFIIPWYLAYGMKGNEPQIPPYTSIMCKMKVAN